MASNALQDITNDEAPTEFYCPITFELMREPLMTRSGLSFERTAILDWLHEHNGTCPMTRTPLTVGDLVPNRRLQLLIREWCDANRFEMVEESEGSNSTRSYTSADFVSCDVTDFHIAMKNAELRASAKAAKRQRRRKPKPSRILRGLISSPRRAAQRVRHEQ